MRTGHLWHSLGVALLAALPLAAPTPGRAAETAASDPAEALAGLRYRNIGPANMGGRVTDIAGLPGDPSTWWVGGADGGLWRTRNGGTTFEGQWQEESVYSVGALAVAPSDHNVLYLGSGEGDPRNSVSYGLGVWKSTDMGETWSHVGLPGTERIKRIRVHPADPDVAWVCALGREWGPGEERGVFWTRDGGVTWKKVLYVDPDTGCSDLEITFANPRILYAGMWTFRRKPWSFDDGGKQTALHKSLDGGETWKKVEVVDEPMARIGVAVAQSRPETVYVVTETPTKGTLFRSDDAGAHWRMVSDDRDINFRPFYYSDIRVDPTNAEVIWSLSGGLYKSKDGGRSFESVGQGIHGDHQSLWIDPANPERVLSGSDGGYQVSFDGGANWDIVNNVTLAQYYQIFVDDRDPYYVCGGLQDNGNWCGPSRSNNAGFGGGGIPKDDWYVVSGGDGFYTVPVPGHPNLVYSNAQGGYLRLTDTETGVTRSIEPYPRMHGSQGQGMFRAKYRFNWDAPIHVSPNDSGTVYWGGNVLFRSRDAGHSWDVISPDLTTNDPEKQLDSGGEIYLDNTAAEFHSTILTVAESPLEAGVLWVGTDDGNVQVSRDGGGSWSLVNANLPGLPSAAWVSKIEASRHVAGRAFVNVDQHRLDDFHPHVWRCDDYGARCQNLSAGLPQDDYTKVIREDPKQADLLFVGMERGLYFSWDGGKSWVDMRLNLPRVSVRDIRVQERDNDLVLGTHGRGAWILDDLTPVQELARARGEKLHVFAPPRATHWQQWNPDAAAGQRSFAGENPAPGALISFYLAEDPGETGLKLRIADADGELVRELKVEKPRVGVNRLSWDLQHTGSTPRETGEKPTGFLARFLDQGAPAVPGRYTASLVLGDQEPGAGVPFEVRGDPRIRMSAADYQAWHDAAQSLVDLGSEVNGMLDQVTRLLERLSQLQGDVERAAVADAELARARVAAAREPLEQLQDALERPAPRMGYRQYPRLGDEIGRLLFSIAGVQAPPTQGQMTVLGELRTETGERRAELTAILEGPIADLNRTLEDLPAIVSGAGEGP